MPHIQKFEVQDFKGLAEGSLSTLHLTVVTGANSSGKSSLLHALLMTAQSVAAKSGLLLNGPLVRLGVPDDVIRDGQKRMHLRFAVREDRFVEEPQESFGNFEVDLTFAQSSDSQNLEVVNFEILATDSREVLFAATTHRINSADKAHVEQRIGNAAIALRVTKLFEQRVPSRLYLVLRGLLPVGLALHKSAEKIREAHRQMLGLASVSDRGSYMYVTEINRLVHRNKFFEDFGEADDTRIGRYGRWRPDDIAALTEAELSELTAQAAIERSKQEWIFSLLNEQQGVPTRTQRYSQVGLLERFQASEFDISLTALDVYSAALTDLSAQVKYIGPLRDEPRVVSGAWEDSHEFLPVGIRGELTAQVLARSKMTQITFADPAGERRTTTVPKAVAIWCAELGIGDDVRIVDQGKLGRGIELKVGGKFRDLTNIGVGASQLLPIIVLAFTAARGSTIVLEQPELHLHPSVQSKLADFLLFARKELNYIVETHSEYLVTRIRLRAAEGRRRAIKAGFLFAESDDGVSRLRRLKLGEFGDFDHWPTGFFDSQESDSGLILAAIARRVENGDLLGG